MAESGCGGGHRGMADAILGRPAVSGSLKGQHFDFYIYQLAYFLIHVGEEIV